jgi:hypothetical protein
VVRCCVVLHSIEASTASPAEAGGDDLTSSCSIILYPSSPIMS